AFAFVMGVAIERIVLRPFVRAPVLTVVVVFLGILFIINSMAGWLFTFSIQAFPSPFAARLGNRYLSGHEIGMMVVTLGTLGAVIGGFIVGVIENVAGAYIVGTELKLSVALVIIVVVLVTRPAGLFGTSIVTRV